MQKNTLTLKQKFLRNMSSFLSMRGRILVFLGIFLFVAIIGIAIYSEIRSSAIERSTILIEQLEEKYYSEFIILARSGNEQQRLEFIENTLASLDDIIARYSRFYAGKRALFLKGEIYFNEGQFENAAKYYSALASRFRRSYLAPISLNNAAVSHEELGDIDSAIRYYRKIVQRYIADYPNIPHVLFSLGRLHETKEDFIAAVEYYNMLNTMFPNSDWTTFSRNRMIYLRSAGKI
ncbi:MAG: tetratricopeptide repeat protein [Spirochaetes bacterium]|nr:tetratricopeptide repeat protein [Spirochaetota bacterium]